jgi:hypothetical protein
MTSRLAPSQAAQLQQRRGAGQTRRPSALQCAPRREVSMCLPVYAHALLQGICIVAVVIFLHLKLLLLIHIWQAGNSIIGVILVITPLLVIILIMVTLTLLHVAPVVFSLAIERLEAMYVRLVAASLTWLQLCVQILILHAAQTVYPGTGTHVRTQSCECGCNIRAEPLQARAQGEVAFSCAPLPETSARGLAR